MHVCTRANEVNVGMLVTANLRNTAVKQQIQRTAVAQTTCYNSSSWARDYKQLVPATPELPKIDVIIVRHDILTQQTVPFNSMAGKAPY
jgi:hypothetical protein